MCIYRVHNKGKKKEQACYKEEGTGLLQSRDKKFCIFKVPLRSCQQPLNITHNNYTNCCLYKVDPPDDKQQACWKRLEAYY